MTTTPDESLRAAAQNMLNQTEGDGSYGKAWMALNAALTEAKSAIEAQAGVASGPFRHNKKPAPG